MRQTTKKLMVAIGLLLFTSQISLAQNASITVIQTADNPTLNFFEVGKPRDVECIVNSLPAGGASIVSYDWSAPNIGPDIAPTVLGHIWLGTSGTNTNSSFTDNNTTSASTVNIAYGDKFNAQTSDIITCTVSYLDTSNQLYTFPVHLNININRICPPNIPVLSVQNCSTAPFTITSGNTCNANMYNWTVTNATIQSGQGTNTLHVVPAASGNIVVSCTDSRTQAVPAYKMTTTSTITRVAPAIPTISLSNASLCMGTSYPISIITTNTGILSTTWSSTGATFSPTVGNSSTLTPSNTTASGSSITVNAITSYMGGCTTTASKSYSVWSTNMVVPAGTFNWVPTTTNQCNIGVVLNFTPSNSVNGTVYCDECGGHTYIDWYNQCPNLGPTKYIPVTVQYVNPCSVSPAKVFSIAAWKPYCCKGLPAPLKMHQQQETLKIYPNPAKESINIDLPIATKGSYVLVDINGREVMAGNFDEADNITMVFPPLNDGLYILNIHTATNNYKEKLIIKN